MRIILLLKGLAVAWEEWHAILEWMKEDIYEG